MNIISIFFRILSMCETALWEQKCTLFLLWSDIWAVSWWIELMLRCIVQLKTNYEDTVKCPLLLLIDKKLPGSAVFQPWPALRFEKTWQKLREWTLLKNSRCWLEVDKEWGLEGREEGSTSRRTVKNLWLRDQVEHCASLGAIQR